jgi:hypothetical protein
MHACLQEFRYIYFRRPQLIGLMAIFDDERVKVHLGTGDPCRFHATASRPYLLRSLIKPLSSSSSSELEIVYISGDDPHE